MDIRYLLTCCALLAVAVHGPAVAGLGADSPFTQESVDKGREQYQRTCAQCHGRNMVNSGTTVYDLRRFPTDQPDRFFNSVTNGKGSMPSFKSSLEPDSIWLLWSYVATRGGKEL